MGDLTGQFLPDALRLREKALKTALDYSAQ
jgi:hypothetical protein